MWPLLLEALGGEAAAGAATAEAGAAAEGGAASSGGGMSRMLSNAQKFMGHYGGSQQQPSTTPVSHPLAPLPSIGNTFRQ